MPDRGKVIERINDAIDYGVCVELFMDILDLLKEQEEKNAMMRMIYGTDAKVVGELVRCNACKHGKPCNDGEINCEKDIGTFKTTVHEPDWFCADGERP